jgi:xre family toxin-antitoxin system, antitoxin component
LALEDFAREVELPNSHISRLQSGEHNPTILTLLDIAERCGYKLEIKVKKSRK